MKAVRDNVVFKPFPPTEKSEGGIIVPGSFRSVNNQGVLVSVGPGVSKNPMRFKEGDVVIRTKGWGTEMWQDGQQYFMMNQDAILSKVIKD